MSTHTQIQWSHSWNLSMDTPTRFNRKATLTRTSTANLANENHHVDVDVDIDFDVDVDVDDRINSMIRFDDLANSI